MTLDSFSLAGRVAVVTGGYGVIGGCIASALADSGARVIILGRRRDAAQAKADSIRQQGGDAGVATGDVLDEQQMRAARDEITATYGDVDILINGAGGNVTRSRNDTKPIFEVPLDAVEEVLRFEPPAVHIGRYVAKDVELQGTAIPEGSVIIALTGAANRDPREFADPDRFDVQRERRPHLTFGYGHHVCLGNALARLEGRIALDELLKRFPEWSVCANEARLASTSTVRGWESLPVATA